MKAAMDSAIILAEPVDGGVAAYIVLERDPHLDRLYSHLDHGQRRLAAPLIALDRTVREATRDGAAK